MNKKIKIGVVVTTLLIIGLFWYNYESVSRDLLFDMNKILGESTNNSYEIRNDVYDFIINEEVFRYKLNTEQTTMLLNIVQKNQLALKYFDNKEMTIKLYSNWKLLIDCGFKDDKISKWISDNFSDGDESRSFYIKKFYIMDDIKLIQSMYFQHIINADPSEIYIDLSDEEKNRFCKKYSDSVFTLKDLNL